MTIDACIRIIKIVLNFKPFKPHWTPALISEDNENEPRNTFI